MISNPGCQLCSLHQTAQSVCVAGEGRRYQPNLPAALLGVPRVMVLGEAPGPQEDRQNRPFVGPSGKMMDEILERAGIKAAYLTNVAKCFPGGKLPHESIKACADYLEAEIKQIKPQYILALGNTAIQRLTGKGKITELAGKEIWSDRYNCWIMPALHPAAILRNPHQQLSWEADILRFGKLVRGELVSDPPVEVHLVQSLTEWQRLYNLLHDAESFVFDFEATPIPWWHVDWKPYCVSFAFDGNEAWVLPLQHPDANYSMYQGVHNALRGGGLKFLMQSPAIRKAAHNAMYDALAWYRTFGYIPYMTHDSMIAAHVLDENRPKALKWLGRTLLGWPDWDIDARKQHPLDKLAKYNGYDSAAAYLLLAEHFMPALQQDARLYDYFMKVRMQSLRMLIKMVARGMHINLNRLGDGLKHSAQEIVKAEALIPVANPGSTQQLGKWLYQDLRLPVFKHTPGGAPSTDEETIQRLALIDKQVVPVLDYRHHTKNKTTYQLPLIEMVEQSFDHRLHPDIRTAAVETMRYSSFMHTIPREPEIRNVVDAPLGWVLCEFDYSQLEARLAAWRAAGCPPTWEAAQHPGANMLNAFHEGRDIYSEVAARVLNKPVSLVTKDGPHSERQMMGKVPTLAMLYDISWRGLQEYAWKGYQLALSDSQAQQMWQSFHDLFPEFARWHSETGKIILWRGWIQTCLGFYRRLPEALSSDYKIQESAKKSGINSEIQGPASEITQTAGVLLDNYLQELEARIVHDVHDALIFEIKDDKIKDLAPLIQDWMERAHLALRPLGMILPEGLLKAEIKIGPWGSGISLEKYLEKMSS